MQTIRVGIVGAAGYTGGELLRILVAHPQVQLVFAHSNSHAGQPWHAVHKDLLGPAAIAGYGDARFSADWSQEVDALFLCQGHGKARAFLDENEFAASVKVIDLSQDFRHIENATLGSRTFIYGLPEHNREQIKGANAIANPGCFATAIQLALLPLAQAGWLPQDVHVQATTGSTGAGQALSETGHFSRRFGNLAVYKAFIHQHLQEMGETLSSFGPGPQVHFIPLRGAFTRGILAAVSLQIDKPIGEIESLYQAFYAPHPFAHLVSGELELKSIVNTNFCYLSLEKVGNQLLVVSALDNLLKGASGQAVQNLNLMFGLRETTGLNLKPLAY